MLRSEYVKYITPCLVHSGDNDCYIHYYIRGNQEHHILPLPSAHFSGRKLSCPGCKKKALGDQETC